MEIPGYKILKTLGRGGMAVVYLAIQESFEREVALKVMSPQLGSDPAFGDRFQREAKIVSQLNHPNIVTVFDVGVVDNYHYLAMEYVPGKELRHLRQNMSLLDKIKVVKEIASALNYAGNKGYVHRDVKPENIMLNSEDGRAVLMDFGIARATDTDHHMTKTGTAIGTPYYMSPEQAQGNPVDKRSDLYSLGVVLFQLLAGYVPYDAESSVAIGIKHITEPVPFLPRHLRVFQPVIEKVMAKEPDKRYQTGAELVTALDKINIMDLDNVEEIAFQEQQLASTTDASAPTVMGQVTSEPPVINTGNVTTADAVRAQRKDRAVDTGAEMAEKEKKPGSSLVVVALIFVVVGVAAWFILQQQGKELVTQQPAVEPQAPIEEVRPQPPIEKPPVVVEQTEETPPIVEAVVPEEPSKLEQLQAQADELGSKLDSDSAVAQELAGIYQQMLELEPDYAPALQGIENLLSFHFDQIKQALAQKDIATAQQHLSILRESFPDLADKADFVELEQQVAQAQQIRDQLDAAEALLKEDALTSPAGENAYEVYQSVLAIDANNGEAKQGIVNIARRYGQLAESKQLQGKLNEGMRLVDKGLSLDAGNAELKQIKARLQSSIDAKRLADKKTREVDQLLKQASDYRDQGKLIKPESGNAVASYRQVLDVDPTNKTAKQALSSIENSYLLGIRYKIEQGQLDEAALDLREANNVFPGSLSVGELLQLHEQKVSEALAAQLAATQPKITRIVVHDQAFQSMQLAQRNNLVIGRTAYFGFSYENFEGATSLLQAVLYDSARTVRIAQKPVVVTGARGDAFFSISRPVEGFQAGGYNIELLLDNEPMLSIAFTITQ